MDVMMRIRRVRSGFESSLYSGAMFAVHDGVAHHNEILDQCYDQPWSAVKEWANGAIALMPMKGQRLSGGVVIFVEVPPELQEGISVPN